MTDIALAGFFKEVTDVDLYGVSMTPIDNSAAVAELRKVMEGHISKAFGVDSVYLRFRQEVDGCFPTPGWFAL